VQFALTVPMPTLLAVCAVLNESLGTVLIACGFMTRLTSTVGALGMAVAFYVSMRLGEEPVRAALFFVIFLGLAITGPGRLSIDHVLHSHEKSDL
jgi:uncharacterized membrane protein YphA (DoxX/SURF4 family)